MDTPVTFDWKIRLPDVLGVLRRDYAGRFPQLASAALETLLERLRDDFPEDFLPALGQELESLGLALVERLDEDDSLMRESEINQKGKARKLWDIEEGKGI